MGREADCSGRRMRGKATTDPVTSEGPTAASRVSQGGGGCVPADGAECTGTQGWGPARQGSAWQLPFCLCLEFNIIQKRPFSLPPFLREEK